MTAQGYALGSRYPIVGALKARDNRAETTGCRAPSALRSICGPFPSDAIGCQAGQTVSAWMIEHADRLFSGDQEALIIAAAIPSAGKLPCTKISREANVEGFLQARSRKR